jgi:hypothetical protein
MEPLTDGLSDESFLDEVYRRFLQRDADERGRDFYVARLREGASRLDVLFGILTGEEFFMQLCRQAFGGQTGNPFLAFAPPGHFYSPIPSPQDVQQLEQVVNATFPVGPEATPGVDLDTEGQLAWLDRLRPVTDDLSFAEDAPASPEEAASASPARTRYYTENGSFAIGDAAVLAGLIRHLRPSRIVEAGAGFSTTVMLDVAERYLGGKVRVDSIDPEPARLRALLRSHDEQPEAGGMLTVHQALVQQMPLDLFTSLRANDILFIDSSHVLKLGSDLSFLLYQVLPRLAPGVFVHFHDIAWPFEYPLASFEMGRAWNEAYALHAFLAHNRAFRIVVFSDYLMQVQRSEVQRRMPMLTRQPRGIPEHQHTACSLWLVREA